ncbi:MAG: class I SAM-dependent methyltransferase [Bacteroidota bacterium]
MKMIKPITRGIRKLLMSSQEKRHALVGPAKEWQMKRDFQQNFVMNQGLKPQHRFVDIGCGTLRGGIPIIEYLETGHYFGLDVREEVFVEARKELANYGLEAKKPVLTASDNFDTLRFEERFDMIFAFSVLIHMADEIAGACLKFVGLHLTEDGAFYANVNLGDRPDAEWQGFPIVFRTVEFYQQLAKAGGLQVETLATIGELGHQSKYKLGNQQLMLKFTKAK